MRRYVLDDTIVAIATALGQGGIGIIRLSGKDALRIADKMFVAKAQKKPSQFKSSTVHYGWAASDHGEMIDEVLVTVMRAPKSYTREDVVEISCHGGTVVLRKILGRAVSLGARIAEPGEFTKRAFLNGRIDLAQAEAVLDIIQAKTEAFLRVSLNQLKGDLTKELENIRELLMGIYTAIEAIVNFPEDGLDTASRMKICQRVTAAKKAIEKLLASSEHGRILKEGINVVICGKPNVGKSSLLNALLKQPRAIVTDIAGTTRDTIEETAHMRGIPFQLIDTAGILEPRDIIEEEAVKRSHLYIEGADLILFVLDADRDISEDDHRLIAKVKDKNTIIVINKCDLTNVLEEKKMKKVFNGHKVLKVSALKKTGLEALEDEIVENIWQGKVVDTSSLVISNVRHIHCLKSAARLLEEALKGFSKKIPLELISESIKSAVSQLDSITGREIDSDLLERIFSEFCVGK